MCVYVDRCKTFLWPSCLDWETIYVIHGAPSSLVDPEPVWHLIVMNIKNQPDVFQRLEV